MTEDFVMKMILPHGKLGLETTSRQTRRLDGTPGIDILQNLNQKRTMNGKRA